MNCGLGWYCIWSVE